MTETKLYALAIVAHPDDESFLLAGTSLQFAEEGKKVGVVCATRGEKGADRLGRNLSEREMAQIRTEELERACSLLKCACTDCGDHPDGSLDKVEFEKLVSELVEKIDYYQPEVVLTFGEEGISGHRDHVVIGRAALEAAKKANNRPKQVWRASMPRSLMEEFNHHLHKRKVHHTHFHEHELMGVPDEQLVQVDITRYAGIKSEALKAHESQYIPNLTFDLFLQKEYFEVISLS